MSKTSKRRQRIREAFDPDALRRVCTMEQDEFSRYGTRVDLEPGKLNDERFYFFQNNGSRVLGVAHLDSVCSREYQCDITQTAGGLLVCSPTLDDRLGAYVILELLPRLGVKVDWLLTTNEEVCDSTAIAFEPPKDYNWMFSFDRGGCDVVMYQYETKELKGMVEASGATVGHGSYSDIADLDHLNCTGFNWGVGYRDYHNRRSHAWLDDTFRMVNSFERFFTANRDDWMPNFSIDDEPVADCLCGEPLDKLGFCAICDRDTMDRYDTWAANQPDPSFTADPELDLKGTDCEECGTPDDRCWALHPDGVCCGSCRERDTHNILKAPVGISPVPQLALPQSTN